MMMDHSLPKLTLILGGAASGKSDFAEAQLAAHPGPRLYLATAEAHDAEMRAKIDRHIARRGPGWRSIEAPRDLAPALAGAKAGEAVLIDCATMWLSNQMMAEADIEAETAALIGALRECAAPCVMVSNELGCGIVPENALARRFREAHGRLNQALAGAADQVALVAAGLPLWLKGGP